MARKNNTAAVIDTPAAIVAAPVVETPAAPVARKSNKPAQIVQNGVAKPRDGTLCHRVWAIADTLATTVEGGYKALRLAVIREGAAQGLNDGNVKTEMSLYRRFHDLPKTIAPTPVADATPTT